MVGINYDESPDEQLMGKKICGMSAQFLVKTENFLCIVADIVRIVEIGVPGHPPSGGATDGDRFITATGGVLGAEYVVHDTD